MGSRVGILLRILLAVCGSASAIAQTPPLAPLSEQLIGMWVGIDGAGQMGGLTFSPDGTVDLVIDGTSMQSQMGEGALPLRYEIDESASSTTIAILGTTTAGVNIEVRGVIALLPTGEIRVRLGRFGVVHDFEGATPDDTLTLRRHPTSISRPEPPANASTETEPAAAPVSSAPISPPLSPEPVEKSR